MGSYKELVLVTAQVFEPGQIAPFEVAAVEGVRAFWAFSGQTDAEEFADTVHDIGTGYQFTSRAIRFEVEPMPNPDFVYPQWRSFIELALSESSCTVEQFFEVDVHEHWIDIVERKLLTSPRREVKFYAVYYVAEMTQRDEEDYKETRLHFEFLGELDGWTVQTTTADLQMRVLRTLNTLNADYFRFTEIEDALPTPPGIPLHDALTHLCEDGLLVLISGYMRGSSFALTEKGRKQHA